MEGRARRSVISTRPSCGWWPFRIPSPLTRPRGQRALSVMADDPAPAPSDSVPTRRPARALLAVRRAHRRAHRRRARRARSRSARGAVRRPQPPVLGHPGVSAVRGRALRRGAGQGPGVGGVSRGRQRRGPATSRPVLLLRRRRAARALPAGRRVSRRPRSCSTIGRFRSRASCGCRCVWFLLLPVDRRAADHHQRVRPGAAASSRRRSRSSRSSTTCSSPVGCRGCRGKRARGSRR